MNWHEKIIAAHLTVTNSVSHSERLKSDRYFVWQEDGSNDLAADGTHAERAVTGRTDLFTKIEFDPWGEALEAALDAAGDIWWERVLIDYEEETGFYHWSWDWEVL